MKLERKGGKARRTALMKNITKPAPASPAARVDSLQAPTSTLPKQENRVFDCETVEPYLNRQESIDYKDHIHRNTNPVFR